MQATEKKLGNKIWLAILSAGVVIALILGIVALVNHGDTKANAIPTINQQVDNIKNTLPELEKVSTELKGYIDTLETTVEKLQTDLTATNTAIDTLETEVYGKVDAEKTATLNQLKADKAELEGKIAAANKDHDADVADLQKQLDTVNTDIPALKTELEGKIAASEKKVLDELNALKTSIEAQIATINTDITALKAKDTELDGKITALQTYVNTELQATEDWANATFATLTQYEAVQTEISAIKTAIDNLNKWNQQTDSLLAQKFEDIDKAIEAARTNLSADYAAKIEAAVNEVTGAYTEAIATANGEIEAAYNAAIASAIADLEKDMQDWVNETLAEGYYDIAAIDAKLAALETKIADGDAELEAELAAQKTALETAKSELTTAYQAAIKTAIDENNGVIDGKIAAAITAAKNDLQNQINAINTEITSIKSRLDTLESNFANRIQSLTFVPGYTDGKVLMDFNSRTTTLDFMLSPANLASQIAEGSVKAYVRYTEDPTYRTGSVTASDVVEQSVESVTLGENGLITVTIKENGLHNDFWRGDVEAVIYIVINDGNNDIVSEAIPMVAHNYVSNTVSINGFADGNEYTGEAAE